MFLCATSIPRGNLGLNEIQTAEGVGQIVKATNGIYLGGVGILIGPRPQAANGFRLKGSACAVD
jgi:hypothetical protein